MLDNIPDDAGRVIEALDRDGLIEHLAELIRSGRSDQAKRIVETYQASSPSTARGQ